MSPVAARALPRAPYAEGSLDDSLHRLACQLVEVPGMALARFWLAPRNGGSSGNLELVASAGQPHCSPGEDWSRTDGTYRSVSIARSKLGAAAVTGRPMYLSDRSPDWSTDREFARREQIRSFAAQPLKIDGPVLGVLGVFSRSEMGEASLNTLDQIARSAAAACIKNPFSTSDPDPLRALIGDSIALQQVRRAVELVAPTNAPVLIQGETGTGKELIAEAIHGRSLRSRQLLIKVNCASIPRELFESEFFGHVRGAFTGALKHRVGRFQMADRGTLFLDEVAEIPLDLQSKLLRVLQEGQFEAIGDDVTRQVNVRIVAATNRDLRQDVRAGRFREDLYYRLCVFPIDVPPLRHRREDLPALIAHLLRQSSRRFGLPLPEVPASMIEVLRAYDWPGNVRELQNVLDHAVILTGGRRLDIPTLFSTLGETTDLPASARHGAVITERKWREMERHNVLTALELASGQIEGPGGAASILGIKPGTLRSRMKAMGLRSAASAAAAKTPQGEESDQDAP